jgi:hypothetical protein
MKRPEILQVWLWPTGDQDVKVFFPIRICDKFFSPIQCVFVVGTLVRPDSRRFFFRFVRKPPYREKTVAERLQDTLNHATAEKTKYAAGYALNIAIGLQVVLGSLTTALSVVTLGKQVCVVLEVDDLNREGSTNWLGWSETS